jgi:hypothetical protein
MSILVFMGQNCSTFNAQTALETSRSDADANANLVVTSDKSLLRVEVDYNAVTDLAHADDSFRGVFASTAANSTLGDGYGEAIYHLSAESSGA